MWSVSQLCRCSAPLRTAPSRLLLSGNRNNLSSALCRQFVTTSRSNGSKLGVSNRLRLTELIKSNGIIVRLCSSAPKPKTSKVVGYWLLGCSGMVFTAVVLGAVESHESLCLDVYHAHCEEWNSLPADVFPENSDLELFKARVNRPYLPSGGVTRLTESGLSMVTWRLLGEKLPTSEEEWLTEFNKYQQYPEFKYKNQSITLSEFKWIWWMEYLHRTWGRCIGAAVFLPAAFLWLRGYLDKGMKIRTGVYCTLVAAQGLMGWYMVKSGLEDRFQGPNDVPRVSQYRLAAHLGLAFVLYAGLLGGALRVLRPVPVAKAYTKMAGLGGVTATAHLVKAMAFVTALSGAFVAGLDAGLVYNSFPKMGDHWIPEDILAFSPRLRNFTENPTTVQFDHRVLGTTTLCLASALWLLARKKPLSRVARGVVHGVGAMAWMQVGLGIMTLLHYVPTGLAASHQSGSLVLLSLAIWLTHEIKLLKYIPK